LSALVNSSDDAIISKDLSGVITSWNAGAERMFGYSSEEAIGTMVSELLIPPDRQHEELAIHARLQEGVRIDHFETVRRCKDGTLIDVSLTVSPVKDSRGRTIGALKIARDITASNGFESALKAQAQVLEMVARGVALEQVLASLCLAAEKQLDRATCSVLLYRQETGCLYPGAAPNLPAWYLDAIRDGIPAGPAAGSCGTAAYRRDAVVVTDIENDPLWLGFGELPLRAGFRACWSRPIFSEAGEVLGVFAAYYAEPRAPRPEETEALNSWLHLASIAVARLQGESALRRSEARFRVAVAAVANVLWTNDAQGHMRGEQPGWAAFTGQSMEEYQGYGWAKAVHPDDAQPTIDAWNIAVAERRMFVFEHRVRRHDGVYRRFYIRALPVLNDNGEIEEWVGVHSDITEERRLAQEKADALEREQSARYTAELLNSVGSLLAGELDTSVLTQKITDLATQLVGAQVGALFYNVVDGAGEKYVLHTISGAAAESFLAFPSPRKTRLFAATFAGQGIVRSDDITKDHRYGHNAPYYGMPKGHLPVRSYLATPVASRSGEVLGGLFFGHESPGAFTPAHERLLAGIAGQAAIALDNARLFTDSQHAREALARSNEELKIANTDLEQFAYSASHDLKEPLRQVSVYSQMLQRRYREKLDRKADDYLRFLVEGAQRMESLVSDLLAYTQAANVDEKETTPVPTGVGIHQAIANLRETVERTGADIQLGPLPILFVREVHLVQLFQNVISNALKYRAEHQPQIRITAQPDGDLWRISVHDNGIGIDHEYSEQIFGLFRRLHTAREYSGTGIGLAICQKIVQRYAGRIWVESEGHGKGSTFCFTLPGQRAAA
jgi:PAS domain S-box-containing protein